MKVDDIRGQLRRRGVPGISALRKPDLVKTLARTLRAEGGGAARRGTGPAGRAPAKKAPAKRAAANKATATRTTGARKAARAKAAPAPARKAAAPRKTTTAAARRSTATRAATGAKAAPAKAAKSATTRAKATTTRAKSTTTRAKAAPARAKAAPAAGARTGRSTARSVRSSQLISSPADRPERPGRSLVTTSHDVIRNWARARGARPATIAGTEREGRPGVLTFEIPGYRESSRVQVITWDDWFRTFDARRLNLIYQEQLRDGRQSNFFRTESPDREDA
ncbi:hypothetical protein ACPFP2_26760 [Micromonospora citrea]|uniref:hypothetical protein n=1 Tax=Micromonospora citrea TaxID=47855 RepID=UPI003C6070F4